MVNVSLNEKTFTREVPYIVQIHDSKVKAVSVDIFISFELGLETPFEG